ncbi:MAG TPA: hypothetical protein PLO44_01045 [Candidatus Paceibacterota bacterium]|nr:hypothetical protein [Candidatus Paceibacterota bacterium]
MLNEEDINKLKLILATKEDLKGLAVKQDVEEVKSDLQESIDVIAKTTAYLLENMATKKDILEIKTEIQDFRVEMKGFKNETENSIKTLKEDTADLLDTDMLHDKRIEKLEKKFV